MPRCVRSIMPMSGRMSGRDLPLVQTQRDAPDVEYEVHADLFTHLIANGLAVDQSGPTEPPERLLFAGVPDHPPTAFVVVLVRHEPRFVACSGRTDAERPISLTIEEGPPAALEVEVDRTDSRIR